MAKGGNLRIICFLFLFFTSNNLLAVTPIKITFMEALAVKDTTSSERFQKEYEHAIETGKELTKKRLERCGYQLTEDKMFYDASDTLQALEKAKLAQNTGAWLVVGPRRSNHYLLVAKGAENTATVSVMASSKEVYELDPLHLTIAQSNKNLAEIAAKEVKSKLKSKKQISYISIVNEDCVSCLDFSESFDVSAKALKLKKLDEIKITGEQPETTNIENLIRSKIPDVVLLPNYSKVSALLIGAINKLNPKIFFVGGDGWGDNKYGFVHNSPQLKSADGLTVKGFPPTDKGLGFFALGKEILKNPTLAAAFPASGSSQALMKIIEGTVDLICKEKPKSKDEFTRSFQKYGKKYFTNPWGVSVYRLAQGEVVFDKTVRLK